MRIRAYLFVLAVAILIPVIAFSGMALHMLQNAERESALRNMRESAHSISLLVDREIASAEAALRVLESSPYLEQGKMAEFYEQAKTAERGPNAWTVLFDENGRQILNRSVPFGTNLPSTVAKAQADLVFKTGRTFVTDILPGPVTKRLVTTVGTPVQLKNGKRYVLLMAFSTDHFNHVINEAHLPQDWLVGLLDKRGRFIARNINREEMVGKSAKEELVKAAKENPQGWLRHTTHEGTDAYDVYTHSALSGWTVAIAAPVAQIEQSARKAALIAGLGMLAAIACAAIAALYFGAKLVNLVRRAAAASAELGRGNMPNTGKSRIVEFNELLIAMKEAGLLLAQAKEYRTRTEQERQALLISERNARKAAEEQNKAKDQFLAMLGHELRNPLAPISTAAQLLKLPGIDEQRLHFASDVISRQTEHMTKLVNDLLDVSRVTRGLVSLNEAQLDMRDIVAGAVEQVSPLIEEKQHRLDVHLPNHPVWVLGDKTRLVQVIVNVLNNAAKYTDARGEIAVDLITEGGWAKVSVNDNGQGIDRDLLPRVFELFSQGERSSDRSQGGLGLGLALVKSLVMLHRGEVTAQSEGNGKGSLFVIRLPLLSATAAGKDDTQAKTTPVSARLRVMVVDDNVDAARSLALYLHEAAGYEASAYFNAVTALEHASFEKPDVFVLDIGLPDMDGYELARRLRSNKHAEHALLIALTGYGQAQDIDTSMAAGFDHHLTKPAEPARLAELIATWQQEIE